MTDRVYNFCAGPACLPPSVLEKARAEFLDYAGLGVSVMEISHRSEAFDEIADRAEMRLRRILEIPDDYCVLFLAGGATMQFAQLPANLAAAGLPGAYLVHGHWGRKAHAEASALGVAHLVASSEDTGFDRIPAERDWAVPGNGAYLHVVGNETISGVQFKHWPETALPLAADMSSDILSRPIPVRRFGVIYAGAQKNAGIAGLSLVIVRRDLLDRSPDDIPGIWSWKTQHESQSRYNTPPTFAWYMAGLVFEWIEAQGGIARLCRFNNRKAARIYSQIDAGDFYLNTVDPAVRSCMNVPFRLADERLTGAFLAGAERAGLAGLKGHNSVGGLRASIYNAMPDSGVRALVDYMRVFERERG